MVDRTRVLVLESKEPMQNGDKPAMLASPYVEKQKASFPALAALVLLRRCSAMT